MSTVIRCFGCWLSCVGCQVSVVAYRYQLSLKICIVGAQLCVRAQTFFKSWGWVEWWGGGVDAHRETRLKTSRQHGQDHNENPWTREKNFPKGTIQRDFPHLFIFISYVSFTSAEVCHIYCSACLTAFGLKYSVQKWSDSMLRSWFGGEIRCKSLFLFLLRNAYAEYDPIIRAVVWFGSSPSPPSTISKLDRRHTGRLRKKYNLTTRGGGGCRAESIRPQESLVFYKLFNPLWNYHIMHMGPVPIMQ